MRTNDAALTELAVAQGNGQSGTGENRIQCVMLPAHRHGLPRAGGEGGYRDGWH